MQYHEEWEEVAKTENAHKAIASDNYQNEKYYNLSGILTSAEFLRVVKNLYAEKCQELNVVEIGCGTGRESKYLKDCFNHLFAIDASETMIKKALQRIFGGDITFEANESGKIPLSENMADIVYSFIVFQHCKHDTVRSYFKEAYRVLKPGGRFIFQLGSGKDYEPINYGDVGQMSKDMLVTELVKIGFTVESLTEKHFGLHIAKK